MTSNLSGSCARGGRSRRVSVIGRLAEARRPMTRQMGYTTGSAYSTAGTHLGSSKGLLSRELTPESR